MTDFTIQYDLSPQEVNVILRSLSELPFKDVSVIIDKMKTIGDKAIAAITTDKTAASIPVTGDIITPAGDVSPYNSH